MEKIIYALEHLIFCGEEHKENCAFIVYNFKEA